MLVYSLRNIKKSVWLNGPSWWLAHVKKGLLQQVLAEVVGVTKVDDWLLVRLWIPHFAPETHAREVGHEGKVLQIVGGWRLI